MLAASALATTACVVDNPAYDVPADAGFESRTDLRSADAGLLEDDADQPLLPEVAPSESGSLDTNGARTVRSGCDGSNNDLQLCLAFEGSLQDLSANKIVVTGDPLFVPGADGLAYQVKNGVGLQTPAVPALVWPRVTADLWVKLAELPETQTQVLVAA